MPKEWNLNRQLLEEYHKIRSQYYKDRAPKFLLRAEILKRDGDPDLS